MSVRPAIGTLSREEILFEIAQSNLITHCADPANQTRGCSFDMSVGTIFWDGKIIRETSANPATVIVPPGGVVGIFTSEELALPDDVCATAFAINVMSSRGFLVLNPGHVDPGFEGPLTIKALNVRKTSIAISQGDPIFTVIFQRLDRSTTSYGGNSSRSERERKFNAEIVQSSPKTIASMIEFDTDGPFPARSEVKDMIRSDAINRITIILAGAAALASIIAVILTLIKPAEARDLVKEPRPPATTTAAGKCAPPIKVAIDICDIKRRSK